MPIKKNSKSVILKGLNSFITEKGGWRKFNEWVILGASQFERIEGDKEYTCVLTAFPKEVVEGWSTSDDYKKQDLKKLHIYERLNAKIMSAIHFGEIRFRNRNDTISNKVNGSIPLIVPINNSMIQVAKQLQYIIQKEIQKDISFFKAYEFTNCVEIIKKDDGEDIHCIFPCNEIVRYFYFTSSKIIRKFLTGFFTDEYSSVAALIKDETTGKKVLHFKAKQGYKYHDYLLFAKLATNSSYRDCAKYIYNNLAFQSRTNSFSRELKTRIPCLKDDDPSLGVTEKGYKLGVTGIKVKVGNHSYFLVTQIHQTTEKFIFDKISWEPYLKDVRQGKDGNQNPINYSGVKKTCSPDNPDEVSDNKEIDNKIITTEFEKHENTISFFPEVKLPEIVEKPKGFQENHYEGTITLIKGKGRGLSFSNVNIGEGGSGKVDISRFTDDENIRNLTNAPKQFIREFVTALRLVYPGVRYFNLNSKEDCFTDKENFIPFSGDIFAVLEIPTGLEKYYLFEKIIIGDSKNRMAIYSKPENGNLKFEEIKRLIDGAAGKNEWPKDSMLERKLFNHKKNKDLITVEDAVTKIMEFI